MINQLAKQIHENAKSKGFYEGEKNIGEMLCLIHSEVSEALECDRKNKHCAESDAFLAISIPNTEHFKIAFANDVKDTFEAELADIMIRVMDLAAYKKINLEMFIKVVMRNNSLREYKHGKKY